jgi:transposase
MLIIGCDYHPSVQQIAFMDTETGEFGERRLEHGDGVAGKFYRDLQQRGISVRVGMEVTGHARWFERLLEELHFDLWIGARNMRGSFASALAWLESPTDPRWISRFP